ncbi:S8 family peptidase [Actinokineospora soli]|uniref:S8 family peptidase n=1 Tax=Actinokineospora soli TaxID=1048753 RepID=A0ABW2TQZ8_9PSEU
MRLKADADPKGLAHALGVSPRFTYVAAVKGFAGKLTQGQLNALRHNDAVVGIEQDAEVTDALETTQTNPPSWGQDRSDQRALPLSNSYTYNATGAGVHAYIIDTGIKTDLAEFEGRASFDFNAVDRTNTDCEGHGTHVAGTVGSKTYGLAKQVRLHAVKMMNCRGGGKTSATIAAIDWVTANAQKPAVANTSWNWTYSDTLAASLRSMISSGVFLATSAGNTGANSCDRLPRNVTEATVVAASDRNDARASFSSTGACVDLYAPGAAIVSTVITGGSEAWNGTSMATPHVTAVAALYKATYGDASAATVGAWLTGNATPDIVSGGSTGGTVNRLLYTNGL